MFQEKRQALGKDSTYLRARTAWSLLITLRDHVIPAGFPAPDVEGRPYSLLTHAGEESPPENFDSL